MARKPTKSEVAPVRMPESQIIEDGDFAGMTYDEVLQKTTAAMDEVYAPLSIQGAQVVTDMRLAEVLAVTKAYEGPAAAQEAALRYGQTIMPYLQVPQVATDRAYGELRKLKHRKFDPAQLEETE